MIIIAYALAVFMGLTLGLIGAGGSILTVPIFVYLMGIKPIIATGYSLLVVGSAALYGSIEHWRKGNVVFRTTLWFALPAMLGVYVTRSSIVPNLPSMILGIAKENMIMLLFSLLMISASWLMLKPVKIQSNTSLSKHQAKPVIKIIILGLGVGFLTGLVGAGGGFIIIPALIFFFALPTKEAIGTSLAVIALNALVGFKGDLTSGMQIDWPLLSLFIALTLLGIAIGTHLSTKVSSDKLKKWFAQFIFVVGLAIFLQELLAISKIF